MIWWNLYERHAKGRARAGDRLRGVRAVLEDFRSRQGLPKGLSAQWSSQTNRESGTVEWFLGDRTGVAKLPATPDLRDVRLTLLALVDGRNDHLRQFTAMLEGRATTGKAKWTVAIHLEDDRGGDDADHKGSGACGHASWHCHVGPDLNAKPKVRVPLPGLTAADAVRWLLTTHDRAMEPASWGRLPERLRAAR